MIAPLSSFLLHSFMHQAIGIFLFLIFLCLSILHFYWGLGGKWGSEAVVPIKEDQQKTFQPGWFACFIVAVGLLAMGLFSLIKAGFFHLDLPGWINRYGLFVLSGIFILRAIGDFRYAGFFKKIKSTRFARLDTKYYSPLCLLLGALLILLELWSHQSL